MYPRATIPSCAVLAAAIFAGACRHTSTTPTALEAVPLQAGTYSAAFSAFTLLPVAQPSTCSGIPADLAMQFPVVFEASGLTWVGHIRGSSGVETGRIVLEPRSARDAPAFSGLLTGSAFTEALGPDGRMVSFGNDGARVSGTVSAAGTAASGTLSGVLAVFWSTASLQTSVCGAGQARLTLTRVQ